MALWHVGLTRDGRGTHVSMARVPPGVCVCVCVCVCGGGATTNATNDTLLKKTFFMICLKCKCKLQTGNAKSVQ